MKRILAEQRGLGLAAQQVGSLHRVALLTLSGQLTVAINLEIIERSKMTVLSTHEGCLSVRPKGKLFRMNVRRSRQVMARWEDESRYTHARRLGGLDAIVGMCSEESVRVIAGFGVCQHHSDLLDRIAGDAKKKRRLARAA